MKIFGISIVIIGLSIFSSIIVLHGKELSCLDCGGFFEKCYINQSKVFLTHEDASKVRLRRIDEKANPALLDCLPDDLFVAGDLKSSSTCVMDPDLGCNIIIKGSFLPVGHIGYEREHCQNCSRLCGCRMAKMNASLRTRSSDFLTAYMLALWLQVGASF